jgi:hypothetical protein
LTQLQLIADLGDDLVMTAFFAALLFIVSYTAMAPWWRTQIGISLIVVDTGLVLALGPSVLHRMFGLSLADQVWYGWYFCASLTLVAAGVLWRTAVMVRDNWDNPRMLRFRVWLSSEAAYVRALLASR